MQFIIKFVDKFSKDVILIDEFFAKDFDDLTAAIKGYRREVGFKYQFEIIRK